MNAAEIAYGLDGRKGSGGWTARCPAHDDLNQASLYVKPRMARCWSAAMPDASRRW
jgi:hypothetical protein